MSAAVHRSVLLRETVAALNPRSGGIYIDGTFGGGGVSHALLDAADCVVLAIDRDPAAIERARALAQEFSGRFEIERGRFGAMDRLVHPALADRGRKEVDGVTLDLGVSSVQLDEAARGFSFRVDGPLDMRMDEDGPSASDIVNKASERELERLIRDYGEERHARRIARAIVEERRSKPIVRTLELANLVANAVHAPAGTRIHPATRTFQALRIAVNEELKELALGLGAAERLLKQAGRLAVVSFHSLEDRIVKLFLAERSKPGAPPSRHLPAPSEGQSEPSFRLLTKRPIVPTADEVRDNPRSRSAKLRVAERLGAPSRPVDLVRLGVTE